MKRHEGVAILIAVVIAIGLIAGPPPTSADLVRAVPQSGGGGGGGGTTLPVADTTAIVKGSADGTKLFNIERDSGAAGTVTWNVGTGGAGNGLDFNVNSATAAFVTNAFGTAQIVWPNTGVLLMAGGSGVGYEMRSGSATGEQRYFVQHAAKALTAGAATAVVRLAVATGAFTGGEVVYTVHANDATDFQARSGRIQFQAVNKAGTETCTVSPTTEATDGSSIAQSSASTLTYTWAADTTPANACDLTLNAASGLTETTLNITYQVRRNGSGTGTTITPQ